MQHAVETVVRVSGQHAQRLNQLAATYGITEEALVAQALDLLFRRETISDEDSDDVELLRRMEAETGPAIARIVPPLDPRRFVVTHAVSIQPDLIRRTGEPD